ncbi:hypothetical protein N7456_002697 [Penicillium angulare]|uniref:Zn(2)-C6 fungal-type domain-containing protein n=1 Tax=Penicillium angulare TaxID=116970 RepID=A0A9W9KQK2_9EURO|nr:hypothetical protein N7456_002697 [Penicillium angulare]
MVGIPGRSQACGTCKRRKKGRPACGQCRKASVHCDGYNLSLTVRFYNGPNKDIRGPIEGVKHRSQVQQSSVGQFLSRTTLGSKASIDLTRAGYELQLEGLFWELYVPKGLRPSLFEESSKALGGSLSVIRDLLPNSDLLRAALGAIALRLIAREKACEFGKEEGIKLHTNALNQMSRALKLKGNDDLETIGAARLFSFYEALFGNDWNCHKTQEKSWYTHQLGDLAILSSKKPSFFATGHAHRIFVDGRLTCVGVDE